MSVYIYIYIYIFYFVSECIVYICVSKLPMRSGCAIECNMHRNIHVYIYAYTSTYISRYMSGTYTEAYVDSHMQAYIRIAIDLHAYRDRYNHLRLTSPQKCDRCGRKYATR